MQDIMHVALMLQAWRSSSHPSVRLSHWHPPRPRPIMWRSTFYFLLHYVTTIHQRYSLYKQTDKRTSCL